MEKRKSLKALRSYFKEPHKEDKLLMQCTIYSWPRQTELGCFHGIKSILGKSGRLLLSLGLLGFPCSPPFLAGKVLLLVFCGVLVLLFLGQGLEGFHHLPLPPDVLQRLQLPLEFFLVMEGPHQRFFTRAPGSSGYGT